MYDAVFCEIGVKESTFSPRLVVTDAAKFASSPSAAANSSSVLSAAGAPVSSALTCEVASAIASDLAVAIAVACAVDTGFDASAVLSTLPRPSEVFVTAATSAVVARSEVSAIP